MKTRLIEFWLGLSSRDQRALTILLGTSVVYLVLKIVMGLASSIAATEDQNRMLQAQLVEMHHWSLEVESESLREGATGSVATRLGDIAQSVGLSYSYVRPGTAGVSVSVQNASQSQVFSWLTAIENDRLDIASLNISNTSADGLTFTAMVIEP